MENIIRGEKISKIYGTKSKYTALDSIDVVINKGEFVCIMGPSGSGKSTCLNLLSTVDTPSIGQVFIKNNRVKGMKNKLLSKFRYENIGYIFQEFNLLNNLTMEKNIGIPLMLEGVRPSEIKKRVLEISKYLGIDKLLHKKPTECSGGQRQRGAVARALVTKPTLIVADEPTASLDTKNSHEILNLFKRLNEEEGTTFLIVTHDNMIASYARKLIFVSDGKIDIELERGDKTQREFFYDIVGVTSKESQALFDNI
ncbi:MAG: ABC transporter ATP-binding protein [Clostridium sp.]